MTAMRRSDRHKRGEDFRVVHKGLRPGNAAMSASTTIEEWLARFGLSRLGATFRDNGIDLDVVALLSDDDLRELGLTIGDRKRGLAPVPASADPTAPPP